MQTKNLAIAFGVIVLGLAIVPASVLAGVIDGATSRAAGRLVSQQAGNGSWTGEAGYTGSIVAGLVNAYQITATASYKTAAMSGGGWILNNDAATLYGDEAYALTCLSAISSNPASNSYRTAANSFYVSVHNATGGTAGYVSEFSDTDPANAVFYLAEHAVAAYYVNAADKVLWRQGVITYLGTITDSTAYYPVMSLGVATWALAQTGPLDSTVINPSAPIGSFWYQKKLSDLPGLLAADQVASGTNLGSFYWRFDHTAVGGSDASGYTEDTVYGTLGLLAANKANSSLNLGAAILAAQTALAGAVGSDGKVYEKVSGGGANYNAYAGEVLQALAETTGPALAMTGPASGLICGQGWLLALTASATNGTPGTVTSVEFFDNGTKITGGNGVLSGGVWTYKWNTAAASFGTHTLTAKATDSGGLTATSAAVSVQVRIPGDGNGDNVVDGEDYGVWQNGYGKSGGSFLTGDYNGDGFVDGEDYGVWQNNYDRKVAGSSDPVAASEDAVAGVPLAMAPVPLGNAPRLIAATPASGAVVSGVTSVVLVFDSDVQVGAGAVEVSGLATGPHSDFAMAYDAATRTLRLTWSQALPADVYAVRVVADFVVGVGGGAPLDGEVGNPANATLPSGDGMPGGDARIKFAAE